MNNMKTLVFMLAAALLSISAQPVSAAVEAGQPSALVYGKKPARKDIRTVIFSVKMHCHKCVGKIQENIAFEKGVKTLEVSFEKMTVTLSYDASKTDEKKLADALRKLGYEAVKVAPAQ